MRLRFVVIILTTLMLFVLLMSGCAASSSDAASSQPSSESSLSDVQNKIIVDAYGRSVKLPADVQTAATVGSAARIVVYAGAQDKLIGVSDIDKTENVGMPYTVASAETFRDLPSTNTGSHDNGSDVNIDELIDLHPDVIISSGSADACDALQEATNIPVVGVFYQNQLFTINVVNSIECVGEALGTESHAQAVVAQLQDWAGDLSSRTKDYSGEQDILAYFGAVTYMNGHNWEGTYANYAPASVSHVRNVANEIASDGYVEVTLEQIAQWNPEFMFINDKDYASIKQAYDQNSALFQGLKAFQHRTIYTQPYYNYNGTNIATGICEAYFIGAMVYPEAFGDIDLDELYTQVYETMLDGFDFYTYMINHDRYFGEFPSLA